ncbi:helix-turn-helix domain-containing protein [Patescibacteria group bacterium]|nr:helix-turn-helix domain-containing protein [Patescibacteria group bacterium]MBP9709778.1 helix-turn-helix domain-containing protein [Patescibacteria group bacterium]
MTQTISPPGIGALLSTDGLVEILGVSRLTVYRLIERRALPVYQVCRRIRASDQESTRPFHAYDDTSLRASGSGNAMRYDRAFGASTAVQSLGNRWST